MGAFTCDDDERSAPMRPEWAGESRCLSAARRMERGGRDIWRAEVGSRSYAVRVAAVPWNDGRLRGYGTFVSRTRGASWQVVAWQVVAWQVVESERVARPMGTQD